MVINMRKKILNSLYVILLIVSIPIVAVALAKTAGAESLLRLIGFPEDMIYGAETDSVEEGDTDALPADPIADVRETVIDPAEEANEKPDRVADEDVVPVVPLIEPKRRAHAISDPHPVTETRLVYKEVEESFFDDALFIGDSRMVGIASYGGLGKAKFFCKKSLSTAGIYSATASVSGYGNVTLGQLFKKASFGKVFIMLGINECASKLDTTGGRYKDLVNWVKQQQPNATIYVMANLLVTKARSDKNIYGITNARLIALNERQAENADNETVFYMDCNEYFGDGKGNLSSTYSGDGVHPYGKYYKTWGQWIREHVPMMETVIISEW